MIVVIDDNRLQRIAARRVLGKSSAIWIPDTPEEVDAIDASAIECAIVDRRMEGRWLEARDAFIARMCGKSECPDHRLVEWTASDKSDVRQAICQAGAYVQKTGTAHELRDVVSRYLVPEPSGSTLAHMLMPFVGC